MKSFFTIMLKKRLQLLRTLTVKSATLHVEEVFFRIRPNYSTRSSSWRGNSKGHEHSSSNYTSCYTDVEKPIKIWCLLRTSRGKKAAYFKIEMHKTMETKSLP